MSCPTCKRHSLQLGVLLDLFHKEMAKHMHPAGAKKAVEECVAKAAASHQPDNAEDLA